METEWRSALWLQYGAVIDMLEQALVACPDSLWRERLWQVPADDSVPPAFAEFWYLTYHTLFWLDLYLSGVPEEDFAPPAPFVWTEVDPVWVVPAQPYTKEELHGYLKTLREKCRATLLTLTDERARQPCAYGWGEGKPASYLELQLYTMRHVQEHAAQLSLLLGQHGIPAEALASVARAQDEPDSH